MEYNTKAFTVQLKRENKGNSGGRRGGEIKVEDRSTVIKGEGMKLCLIFQIFVFSFSVIFFHSMAQGFAYSGHSYIYRTIYIITIMKTKPCMFCGL